MKKTLSVLLILIMAVSLVSCTKQSKKGDANDIINDAIEEAKEFESFSVEAVEYYLSKELNIKLSEIAPDWEYTVDKYCAYATSPGTSTGRATIQFTKSEGEVTEEMYKTWLEKVFALTASLSEEDYNVIGYEFAGEGEDALSETTLEEATSGLLSGWGFKKNGQRMAVYVSREYGDSVYNGVKIEICVGMQMSWEDTFSYFEENEDEINKALDDYFN